MMNDSILSCWNLSKNFGYHSALSGVNMDIPRGRIIGLLGPNGSGKTTFMKLANGLLVPSEGEIIIGGTPSGTGDEEDCLVSAGDGISSGLYDRRKSSEVFL